MEFVLVAPDIFLKLVRLPVKVAGYSCRLVRVSLPYYMAWCSLSEALVLGHARSIFGWNPASSSQKGELFDQNCVDVL